MIRPALALVLALALPAAAMAGSSPRDAVLADYAAQAKKADPAFTAFSAQRGETLFRAKWTGGGDARTTSCTSCHTDDPKQPGQNAKTGRPINPVAVSINPKRFTDISETEKQFGRDCKNVIGRECTPTEKGDYITFMAGQ
jgi:predicted CxxxxCH...CXXCH cytochrome family protein